MTSVLDRPPSGPDSPPSRPRQDRPSPGWYLTFLLGSVGLLLVAFTAVAIAAIVLGDDDTAGPTASDVHTTIDVVATDYAFNGPFEAPTGTVTLRLINNGGMLHNAALRETGAEGPQIMPGNEIEIELGFLEPGEYTVYCSVVGHEALGMVTTLVVTG